MRTTTNAPTLIARLIRSREFSLLFLLVAIGSVVACRDTGFLSAENLRDILVRCAPTAIVACGVMLVVVTGEIDISVGSLMGLLARCMGVMLSANRFAWPLWVGLPLTLILGTSIGLLTGCLVAVARVPSIIATLGLMTVLRGATMMIMAGENIDGLPDSLGKLAKYGVLGLPISVWIAMVVIVFTQLLIYRWPLGRRLYALGSSDYSASMIGLSTTRLKLFAFTYVGFLVGLATIADVPRLPKIESGIGLGFELLVVTCVVVGGVAITGGRGRLTGVLLAVVLLTMVRPVLTYMDVGEAGEKWTKAIQGAFIIAAIVAEALTQGRTSSPAAPRKGARATLASSSDPTP